MASPCALATSRPTLWTRMARGSQAGSGAERTTETQGAMCRGRGARSPYGEA